MSLTDFGAFIATNLISFGSFLDGTYNPQTDTPFSESWTLPNQPRITFTNPQIVTVGALKHFQLSYTNPDPDPHVFLGIFYAPKPGTLIDPPFYDPPAYFGNLKLGIENPLGTVRFLTFGAWQYSPFPSPTVPTTLILRPNNHEWPVPGPPGIVQDSPPLDQLYSATFTP
jgi:hypothetical protein